MNKTVRLAGIAYESLVNGPGMRRVFFAQGCKHKCEGCFNPETHSFDDGEIMDMDKLIKDENINRSFVKEHNKFLRDSIRKAHDYKFAGYYSKGRDSDKIEIDYLQKKNVKKPNGSAPGFVVYYTNYSLTIHPDISGIKLADE